MPELKKFTYVPSNKELVQGISVVDLPLGEEIYTLDNLPGITQRDYQELIDLSAEAVNIIKAEFDLRKRILKAERAKLEALECEPSDLERLNFLLEKKLVENYRYKCRGRIANVLLPNLGPVDLANIYASVMTSEITQFGVRGDRLTIYSDGKADSRDFLVTLGNRQRVQCFNVLLERMAEEVGDPRYDDEFMEYLKAGEKFPQRAYRKAKGLERSNLQ